MKFSKAMIVTFFVLLALPALGQTAADNKQFNKDGLTFDYPSAWMLQDQSSTDAQQLTIGKNDSDAQIRVFVFRTLVSTPERLVESKKVLVDPYVNSTAKQFEQMGAKPERLPATSSIAGTAADGVKLQAVLDGQAGAAEIYWGVVGQRLVVLTFFGPDKARTQTATTWDTIRNSLKVAESAAAAKPTPSPK